MNRQHWKTFALALFALKGVGRARVRRALQAATDASVDLPFEESYSALMREAQLPTVSVDELRRAWSDALRVLDQCFSEGIEVLVFGRDDYPERLCRLGDAPALILVKGRLEKRKSVAVIGTRNASSWGLKTAEACSARLVSAGAVVVSGLALGIDSAAHEGAVLAGGQTWAVLPGGHDHVAPASNRPLAVRILESGGALVSEYAPHVRPTRPYFVERDRIQAGLSDAVLVIETGPSGGSMHTVRFAQAASVPVWVTFPEKRLAEAESNPTDLPEEQLGTWRLLTEGATRILALGDLDDALVHSSATTTRDDERAPTSRKQRLLF